MGFGVGHIALLLILFGFIMPKWFDVFVPPSRRGEGNVDFGANVPADVDSMEENARMEMAKKNGEVVDDVVFPSSSREGGNDLVSASSSNGDKAVKDDEKVVDPTTGGHVTH